MASKEKVSVMDGPAIWNLIHTSSLSTETETEKEHFEWEINQICINFRCKECSNHCKEYLLANPLRDSWTLIHNKKDVGLFTWTWKFHNAVNKRIGKKLLDFDTALKMYSDLNNIQCEMQCSADEVNVDEDVKDTELEKKYKKPIVVNNYITHIPKKRK